MTPHHTPNARNQRASLPTVSQVRPERAIIATYQVLSLRDEITEGADDVVNDEAA